MRYTVIARNPNSWSELKDGDRITQSAHEITYNCGHRHQTLKAAVQCKRKLAGTTDSLHAGIENYAADQKWDGKRIDAEAVADEEMAVALGI